MNIQGKHIAIIALIAIAIGGLFIVSVLNDPDSPADNPDDTNPNEYDSLKKEINRVSADQVENYFNEKYQLYYGKSLYLDRSGAVIDRFHTVWDCGSEYFYTVIGTGVFEYDNVGDVNYRCTIGKINDEWTIAEASLYLKDRNKTIDLFEKPYLMVKIGVIPPQY